MKNCISIFCSILNCTRPSSWFQIYGLCNWFSSLYLSQSQLTHTHTLTNTLLTAHTHTSLQNPSFELCRCLLLRNKSIKLQWQWVLNLLCLRWTCKNVPEATQPTWKRGTHTLFCCAFTEKYGKQKCHLHLQWKIAAFSNFKSGWKATFYYLHTPFLIWVKSNDWLID